MEESVFKEMIKQDIFNDGRERLDLFFHNNSISNRLKYYINNKTEILSLFSDKYMQHTKRNKEDYVALICILLDIKKKLFKKGIIIHPIFAEQKIKFHVQSYEFLFSDVLPMYDLDIEINVNNNKIEIIKNNNKIIFLSIDDKKVDKKLKRIFINSVYNIPIILKEYINQRIYNYITNQINNKDLLIKIKHVDIRKLYIKQLKKNKKDVVLKLYIDKFCFKLEYNFINIEKSFKEDFFNIMVNIEKNILISEMEILSVEKSTKRL